MMTRRVILAFLAALLLGVGRAGADDATNDGPVFELRTYTTNPGKLPDLHKRFRDHTMRIFERHGIANVGYWVPVNKPDTLIYIIRHKSRDAATESWKAFQNDPEWKKVRAESEKDGPILKRRPESQYMSATDYSPMK